MGYPSCAGSKSPSANSLTDLYPRIASEWHYERNSTLTPDRIASGSSELVWWRCTAGPAREWQALVSGRSRHGYGCPAALASSSRSPTRWLRDFRTSPSRWIPYSAAG
ncbi:zinc-ribbon domain-containing protein [Actinoplanes aureus]|uniref:Zinc-ribbon domain-containing protein n=1 Tax=Actinoplanes aureus TaxID=2792083 RepID=A0A931G1P8_9ACTN|nr:zinc-ribbon domain-containing protein [Actinoplanes aureus]